MGRELDAHPLAYALIDTLTFDIGLRPGFSIERVGPPVEHPLARAHAYAVRVFQDRFEHNRRRTVRLVEVQRDAEAGDEFEAFRRAELRGVDPAQTFARAQQVGGLSALAKLLQVCAGCD